jgi:hypothetical protein
MYGAEYWYIDNPEAASGYMNARVYKKISFTYHGYNASGESIDVPMDLILRMSLFGGMNLSGDIWENHAGGYEHIGTCATDKTANAYGHLIDMYIQPD